MNSKIKVAYISVGENLSAELIRRQVNGLLGEIKSQAKCLEITLFSFQGLLAMINHHDDIKQSRMQLKELGIDLVIIPNICPWPIPNPAIRKTDVGWRPDSVWNRHAAIAFRILALPLMLFLRFFKGYKLFHCRSYPAAGIAFSLKKLVPDISVLFDPRSDFPEENVTSGNWKLGSKDYLYWKSAESDFLVAANAVACIGPTYVDHYKKNYDSFKYFIAPNNVKCSDFRRNPLVRESFRKELGIVKSERVYVYLGGMTKAGWHRPDFYVKFYDLIKKVDNKFKFLFLVPKHSADLVKDAFGARNNVLVFSPLFGEVEKYLSVADFGMMFLHRSKIAVGTKIGEYLAASLPVIVNHNCVGAIELIGSNPGIGYSVNLGTGDLDPVSNFDQKDFDSINSLSDTEDSLADFAYNYFDNSRIADIYIQLYTKLLKAQG